MEKEIAIAPEPPAADEWRTVNTVLGLRRSAVAEILLFLAAALVIDYFFFAGDRFAQTSFHPFWIIVLLVSAQYGTGEGLLAAGLCSAGLLLGNLTEQELTQDRYQYIFELSKLPVLWFSVALILGELRMRHIRERDDLRGDLQDTRKREGDISTAYEQLSEAKDKLEARVAAQMNTALTIYEAAREIEKLDPAEVLSGMADVVRSVMKPEKFAIYILKENSLELAIHEGWDRNDSFARGFNSATGIFREVIGTQRYLCCADSADEKLLAGEGLLAGPLMSEEKGEVFGMLKIEQLGFLKLNFSNIQTFNALCRWVGTAYANARLYEAVRSDSLVSQDSQLFSQGFFQRHTAHLAELARRIGFDLSMLILRLENDDELSSQERGLIPAALAQAVQDVLRKTDLVFEHRRGAYEYAVVLPATPVRNAEIVAEKLLRAMRELLQDGASQARFSTTLQNLNQEAVESRMRHGDLGPEQSEFLVRFAKRVGFDLSLIELRLSNVDEYGQEMRIEIHDAVYQLLDGLLPQDGSMVSCRPASCVYQILIFPMNLEEARIEAESLREIVASRMEGMGTRAEFSLRVQAMHQQSVEEMQDVQPK